MSQSIPIINEFSIEPADASQLISQSYANVTECESNAGDEFWMGDDERTRVRLLRQKTKAKGMKRPTIYKER